MSKDYYKILGVEKNASQDEIKKAFRQKAHQCHPDKAGGDEAKFKELNEAYQVLGDQKKRAQYDQFGSAFEHAQSGGGFGGFEGFRDFSGYSNGFNVNMDDLGDILGGFGDIFGFGGRSRTGTKARRGQDIEASITIDFMEAVFGAEKEVSLNKTVRCDHCQGQGHEPGAKIETCQTCGGRGHTVKVQRTVFGNMQVQMACSDCNGEGKKASEKCQKCGGQGLVRDISKLKIKIPAGINHGETIRLSGQGEAGQKGAPAGDLYLKIRVNPDKRFERDGYDIKSQAKISFTEASLGGKIEVETTDGPVDLKIPSGTQPGTVFKLKGKGIPHLQPQSAFGSAKRGDHFVEVQVKVPTSLSWKQKSILKDLNI